MAYEPPVQKPVWTRWAFSYRALAYAITSFFIFSFTCIELGLVSQQLHKYGNSPQNYATQGFQHLIGLMLYNSIITLLYSLSHFWLSVGFTSFISLILAVFWGTGAGLLRTTTPYRGTHCDRPPSAYAPNWAPFANECSRIITIEAIGWTLWGIFIFLLIGTLVQKLQITVKSTPEEMYFARESESEKAQV
ncbi:hypothetical protein AX17_007378 [Amanita inopinata Kibby_2008]|nr:hypothetical protein AX17_007378 [Amanita inopinata Kibby_2008]